MSKFHDPGSWGDSALWSKAAQDFNLSNPYEAKCLYVLGTIRHLTHAANKLYPRTKDDSDHRLPACILSFNILELWGRCLKGDTEHRGGFEKRIKRGLRYIANLDEEKSKTIFTVSRSYQVPSDTLLAIRNFSAHGFYGSSDSGLVIDGLLVAWMFGSIVEATQRYYEELKQGKFSEGMMQATIQPLCNSGTGRLTRIGPVLTVISNGLLLSQPREKEGEGEENWHWTADFSGHDFEEQRKFDEKKGC